MNRQVAEDLRRESQAFSEQVLDTIYWWRRIPRMKWEGEVEIWPPIAYVESVPAPSEQTGKEEPPDGLYMVHS